MVSLTGKPPFATDEPDSFYESAPQPQRRLRQPPPQDPNERTSAYNLYDNYLGDDNNSSNQLQVQPSSDRNSGIGALGMGLLNMEDSDSEDEDDIQPKPNSPPGLTINSSSKHAALAAATASPSRPNFPPIPQQQQPQQQPSSQVPSSQPQARPPVMTQVPHQVRGSPPPSLQSGPHQHVPQPIAAPRPGYPAPIATLNLARPEQSATPVGRMPNPNHPQPHNNPFEPPPYPQPRSPYPMPASPAPSTPHPLHPSVTPITPAFIRPSKSPAPSDGSTINVRFTDAKAIPRKAIIRGNSEETLLPGRGEKGDDFWRRFSMVAKDNNERKESSWLHKTRNGSTRQTRIVWFTAIIILLLIAGGVVLGVFLRRNTPAHQQPTALGGSANNSLATTTSSIVNKPATQGQQTSQTSLHVTPTLTLANREPDSSPLAAPAVDRSDQLNY